jgi:hypothetical protein
VHDIKSCMRFRARRADHPANDSDAFEQSFASKRIGAVVIECVLFVYVPGSCSGTASFRYDTSIGVLRNSLVVC